MQSPSAFQLSVYISLHLEEGKPTLVFPSSKPSSLPSQKILFEKQARHILNPLLLREVQPFIPKKTPTRHKTTLSPSQSPQQPLQPIKTNT